MNPQVWPVLSKYLQRQVRYGRCIEVPLFGKFQKDKYIPTLELVSTFEFYPDEHNISPLFDQTIAEPLSLSNVAVTLSLPIEEILQFLQQLYDQFESIDFKFGVLTVANGVLQFKPTLEEMQSRATSIMSVRSSQISVRSSQMSVRTFKTQNQKQPRAASQQQSKVATQTSRPLTQMTIEPQEDKFKEFLKLQIKPKGKRRVFHPQSIHEIQSQNLTQYLLKTINESTQELQMKISDRLKADKAKEYQVELDKQAELKRTQDKLSYKHDNLVLQQKTVQKQVEDQMWRTQVPFQVGWQFKDSDLQEKRQQQLRSVYRKTHGFKHVNKRIVASQFREQTPSASSTK